jgi:hypothetical protein
MKLFLSERLSLKGNLLSFDRITFVSNDFKLSYRDFLPFNSKEFFEFIIYQNSYLVRNHT